MDQNITHFRDNLLLKIANEITYLSFFASIILCLVAGMFGHGNPTYLGPASMTYGVWIVILVLFIGSMAYQWTDSGRSILIDGLHWRLSAIFVLATVHLHLWLHGQWLASFFFVAFLGVAVTHTYYILKRWYPARNVYEEVLVHTPISMLHAWTTFLVLEVAFEAFGEIKGWVPHKWTTVYFIISMVILEIAAAHYAFATPDGDFIAGITMSWAIYGVSRRLDSHTLLGNVTFVTLLISLVFAGKSAYSFYTVKYATLKDSLLHPGEAERAPLLGTEDD